MPNCASPGLQSGEAGFQTRENALSCNDRALALVRMPLAPQSTRTFFVTSTTVGRRALLQSDRMAQLLVDVLAENRRKGRFLLSRETGNSFPAGNMASKFRESPHSRRRGLHIPPHLHLGESGQSGLARKTGAVCVVIRRLWEWNWMPRHQG